MTSKNEEKKTLLADEAASSEHAPSCQGRESVDGCSYDDALDLLRPETCVGVFYSAQYVLSQNFTLDRIRAHLQLSWPC